MNEILNLEQINPYVLFVWVIIVVVAVQFLISKFDWFVQRFGIETKFGRARREDHDLTTKTANRVTVLEEKHNQDADDLKKCLADFIAETRKENAELRNIIQKQDADNHNHWNDSVNIRKDINKSIQALVDSNKTKDEQIQLLMNANKEMLAEKINEKYKYYLSIGGIPEDEYDEFVSMHKAYNGVGGNSHGDAKFEYCIQHLPMLPVETKLVTKHKE